MSFFFSSRRRHTRFDCDWSSDGALPISRFHPGCSRGAAEATVSRSTNEGRRARPFRPEGGPQRRSTADRKSTRLNSSHSQISYAVFCLKKKKKRQDVRLC